MKPVGPGISITKLDSVLTGRVQAQFAIVGSITLMGNGAWGKNCVYYVVANVSRTVGSANVMGLANETQIEVSFTPSRFWETKFHYNEDTPSELFSERSRFFCNDGCRIYGGFLFCTALLDVPEFSWVRVIGHKVNGWVWHFFCTWWSICSPTACNVLPDQYLTKQCTGPESSCLYFVSLPWTYSCATYLVSKNSGTVTKTNKTRSSCKKRSGRLSTRNDKQSKRKRY